MTKYKNNKTIAKKFFLIIACIILGFFIYRIPYVSYKINSISKLQKSDTKVTSSEKNLDEIIFSPYIMDSKLSSNYVDFKKCDVTLGLFEDSNKDFNLKDLSFTPNVIVNGNNEFKNTDSNLLLYKNHFTEVSINGHCISFLYLDNALYNANDISSFANIIKDLKSNNSFLVLYISQNIKIGKEALKFLANCGVNIIFSPKLNNIYIEKIQNSIIIYGVEKTSNFIPQFNIVFDDDSPISLGLKILVNPEVSNDETLKSINSLSKNINFTISNKYNFIEY